MRQQAPAAHVGEEREHQLGRRVRRGDDPVVDVDVDGAQLHQRAAQRERHERRQLRVDERVVEEGVAGINCARRIILAWHLWKDFIPKAAASGSSCIRATLMFRSSKSSSCFDT